MPEVDANAAERPRKVGVLFVHGMGRQAPGDTLIDFGEPLFRWLTRWGANPYVQRPFSTRALRSALQPPALAEGAPPHFEFEIVPGRESRTSSPPPPSRWTLAESCWAGEFRDPPFGRLAAWMISVGAWTVVSHYAKQVRARFRSWRRPVLGLPLLLAAIVLALLVQLMVALLAVLAVIPVPRLRRALSGLLRLLTGTLGDSYVLLSSPVQERAAVDRVRHDVAWLAGRVDRVVVVAHSMGAAIAHAALRGERSAKVKRLVTFGSGLGKLEELSFLSHPDQRAFLWKVQAGLPLMVLSLLALPRALAAAAATDLWSIWNLWLLLLVIFPLVVLGAVLTTSLWGWPELRRHLAEKLPLEGIAWHDCYATSDPVPNGPLLAEARLTDESRVVRNEASAVADHSAYWRNEDEFVTWVVQRIDGAAATGLVSEGAVESRRPEKKRAFRVGVLRALRGVLAAGFLLALGALRGRLVELAQAAVWQPLTGVPELGWLGAIVKGAAGGAGQLLRLVTGVPEERQAIIGLGLLGVLLVAAGFAAAYGLAVASWRWWNRTRMAFFFGAEPFLQSQLAVVSMVLFGLGPVLWAAVGLYTGSPSSALELLLATGGRLGRVAAVVAFFVLGGVSLVIVLVTPLNAILIWPFEMAWKAVSWPFRALRK